MNTIRLGGGHTLTTHGEGPKAKPASVAVASTTDRSKPARDIRLRAHDRVGGGHGQLLNVNDRPKPCCQATPGAACGCASNGAR